MNVILSTFHRIRVLFKTQFSEDIPNDILHQLNNKLLSHGYREFGINFMKCSRLIIQKTNRSYEWILFVLNTMKLYYPLYKRIICIDVIAMRLKYFN